MPNLTERNAIATMIGPSAVEHGGPYGYGNSNTYFKRKAAVENAVFNLSNEKREARELAELQRSANRNAAAAANLNARRNSFAAEAALYKNYSTNTKNTVNALEAKRAASLAALAASGPANPYTPTLAEYAQRAFDAGVKAAISKTNARNKRAAAADAEETVFNEYFNIVFIPSKTKPGVIMTEQTKALHRPTAKGLFDKSLRALKASKTTSFFGGKRTRKNRRGTRKQRRGCRKTSRRNRN